MVGVREFFRRWKQGLKDLSDEQLLRAKMTNQFFGAAGLVFVIVTLWFFGAWYWIAFLGFMVAVQVVSGLQTRRELGRFVLARESQEQSKVFNEEEEETIMEGDV